MIISKTRGYHKTVNIICPEYGWILRRLVRQLATLPYVAVNDKDIDKYQINYYCNYLGYIKKSKGVDIAYFTHIEESNPVLIDKFFSVAQQVDLCVCQAHKYADILRSKGIKNVKIIPAGVDFEQYQPKLLLGFIGRFYDSKRKGEELLSKIRQLDFIEIKETNGKIHARKMSDFYNSIDYVLITSKYEGGPMCLIEGLSMGKEIIAPKGVGMVDEFNKGIYKYKPNDINSLVKILKRLYHNKIKYTYQVSLISSSEFVNKHNKLFVYLINNKQKDRHKQNEKNGRSQQ